MKTILPYRVTLFGFLPVFFFLTFQLSVNAQTYTTVNNGLWNLPTTWKSGLVPPATNIPSSAVINIKHIVSYIGGSINNSGTININNGLGVSARLILPGGIDITNKAGGKIYITNGEFRQYRYLAGLELGVAQTGKLRNIGGTINATNSFVEVAQDWTNESSGVVSLKNSVLLIGRAYNLTGSARDTIENTSVSIGLHGTGDYIADGYGTHFQNARIQVASTSGRFELKGGRANGVIDHIVLKNHITKVYSDDKIRAGSNLSTTGGLVLRSYCIGNGADYEPDGKFSGPQTRDCSEEYFPAGLMGSTATASFNFSTTPVLVSGNDLRVGATYKYEGVTPGVDAIVTIDSLVGGAVVTKLDDNTGGLGYIEGFQPEIKVGQARGTSYAVFTINYKVSGTNHDHVMNTFSITALDIDGSQTLKEFDEIDMGPGAVAEYIASTRNISVQQPMPGVYRATNSDAIEYDGIDTVRKQNMFTVSNNNVSSFRLKLGVNKTNNSQPSRQFGIYMKGFVYPSLATLPVQMVSFTAFLNQNDAVDLNWTTASEKNVSHFDVEKSLDGVNYSKAAMVFAFGNTTETMKYAFTDKSINTSKPGVIYYRIRSVDNDGSSELSIVRSIRIGKQEEQVKILAYPNPVVNELKVTIPSAWQGKQVSYTLYNNHGQVLKQQVENAGSQTETIDMTRMAPGYYVVKVTCGDEAAHQKIIRN